MINLTGERGPEMVVHMNNYPQCWSCGCFIVLAQQKSHDTKMCSECVRIRKLEILVDNLIKALTQHTMKEGQHL